MGRTFIRQDDQIRESVLYDDTVAAGATMESSPGDLEDDLNSLRSQQKRAIWADAAGNWYDDIPTYNAKKRGVAKVNEDLDDLETKPLLFRNQKLDDISVPATQNYVVLSGTEKPSETAAVDVVNTEGAVVAYYSGFPGHSLVQVDGANDIKPNNLCLVVASSDGQPIQSGGRDVWALLQSEDSVDGHTFNDTDHRVQLSFVRVNSTGDDLEACPVADIESTTINYSYVRQSHLDNIPKWAFLTGAFLDQTAVGDVTLDLAIDNQTGIATQTGKDIDWDVADDYEMAFTSDSGGTDMFKLSPAAAGDVAQFNVDDLDVNTTNPADFSEGVKLDTGGEEIDIGVNAGFIESTGSNDLTVKGAAELLLEDVNRAGSTWAQVGIKLSETTQEWDDYESQFGGEVSLLKGIVDAAKASGRSKGVAACTADIAANTNVTGAGGSPNIDAQLPDYSAVTFVDDVDVFVNGELQRNGADASANHDVYPGTTPANGDLMFEYKLHGTSSKPDQITMIVHGV